MSMNTKKLSIHSNYLHKYLHNNYLYFPANKYIFLCISGKCVHGSQTLQSSLNIEALEFPWLNHHQQKKSFKNHDKVYFMDVLSKVI